MDQRTREQYLEAQIFTATPQRLHLLLIGGAQRFALQLRNALEGASMEAAGASAARLRDVLTEMLTSVTRDDTEVARRMRALYVYLIRELGEAMLHHSVAHVDNIVSILAIEHETWQLAAQQSAEGTTPAAEAAFSPSAPINSAAAAFDPQLTNDAPSEPFSLHA
jgi:flagellar protein FliS